MTGLNVLSCAQVVTYLLAHKLMSPGKFTLLRGNHETRLQNCHSGYLNPAPSTQPLNCKPSDKIH